MRAIITTISTMSNLNPFNASNIYTENLRLARYGARRIIDQGGQWSGKTVNKLAALLTLANEDTDVGVTTVTSMSMPHLKGGAIRDFEMYVYPHFKSCIRKYHKTDHLFTLTNGSLFEFKAFENEMKARGGKRKRLFVNEANSFEKILFFQLDSRSEQSFLDYNPSTRFWVHDDLIGQPGNELIISDHRHNPFLSEAKHREIESIYDFETKRGDLELFKVYARGITGNITGIIFPNWKMIDECDFPENEDAKSYVYSVDFGYTVDPTAIIKQIKIGNTLYIKELAYETGNFPAISIINVLKANGWNSEIPVYCEHDPDMIFDLRRNGCPYADFARKGQGSINAGIELLRGFDVRYTNLSKNLHRERGLYVWQKEKATGKLINIPVENNNHCMDAIRYGAYTRYLKAGQ